MLILLSIDTTDDKPVQSHTVYKDEDELRKELESEPSAWHVLEIEDLFRDDFYYADKRTVYQLLRVEGVQYAPKRVRVDDIQDIDCIEGRCETCLTTVIVMFAEAALGIVSERRSS